MTGASPTVPVGRLPSGQRALVGRLEPFAAVPFGPLGVGPFLYMHDCGPLDCVYRGQPTKVELSQKQASTVETAGMVGSSPASNTSSRAGKEIVDMDPISWAALIAVVRCKWLSFAASGAF